MTLQSNTWQSVPGARQATIYPILTKPSVVSSNCYIVDTQRAILVIDPGANPDQTKQINEVIGAALAVRDRPVLVFITHCHHDHSGEAGSLVLPVGTEVRRFAHYSAAEALDRGDRVLTVAYLYPWEPELCSERFEYRLFGLDARSGTTSFDLGRGGRLDFRHESAAMPDGGLFDCLTAAVGEDERLDIYHTPGHTACSLSMRLGSMLIMGDLPFAANPGVCGLAGWSQTDLLRTLGHVDSLFERSQVTVCCPGHGYCVPADIMRRKLGLMASEAKDLAAAEIMSEGRIDGLKRYVDELLEETAALTTILSGRLYTTSYYLSLLDESEAAERVTATLDLDGVDRILTEFRGFVEAFSSSTMAPLTVVLRGVQVARALQDILADRRIERVLDASLVGRAQRRLADFLAMVRGLQFLGLEPPCDVNAVIADIVARTKQGADVESPDLVNAMTDDQAFLEVLTRRLAAHSPLGAVELDFTPTVRPTSTTIGAERLGDIVTSLAEALAGAGTQQISIATSLAGGAVLLRLSPREPVPLAAIGARRLDLYKRSLEWLGGTLAGTEHEGRSIFELRVPTLQLATSL